MVIYSANTLVVQAAGCIRGSGTESSIVVTGGRVLSIIKGAAASILCCPVLLETEFYKM